MDARTVTRRTLRMVVGCAFGAGLVGTAGLVAFVGLWTYAGYKTTPAAPSPGLAVLAAAVALFASGGMALAWAVAAASPQVIRRVGEVFALIAGAVVWCLVSAA